MKTALLAVVATLAFAPSLSAQENPTPPAGAPAHSEGTKPHNRGTTGWGGGAREPEKPETTGSVSSPQQDAQEAVGQPPLASGVDLKGPPKQFPPTKTPE